MTLRVVAIVQARMGSTRLPGKTLALVLGKPILEFVVERVRAARKVDALVVATSTNPNDDMIADFCAARKLECFRGSEQDVLLRYRDAAVAHHADVVVRVSADSPLIDPALIDELIEAYLTASPPCDYVSNTINQTVPPGMNAEVFSFAALETASREATLAYDREHVTPFLYHHRERFTVREKHHTPSLAGMRLTVDQQEDLDLVRAVLERLFPGNPRFTLKDVVQLFEREPALGAINAHVRQTPAKRE